MGTPTALTVKDLLDAGVHFGHQTKRWNPKMKKYIFDKRNGIHIIDLTKSITMLNDAVSFLHDVAASGKSILLVGTKKQAQQAIEECAKDCGQFYVTNRWLGGTLTNAHTLRLNVKRMKSLEEINKSEAINKMPKKEVSVLRHELEKLKKNLCGISEMNELPGAIFVVDINREAIAVAEAKRLEIPVVAIVDTNTDPDPINYAIPGNDDAIRAIRLIAGAIAEAVKKGNAEYSVIAAEMAQKAAEEAKNNPPPQQTKPAADRRRPPRRKPTGDRKPAAGKGKGEKKHEPAEKKVETAEKKAEPAEKKAVAEEKKSETEQKA